MVTLNDYAGLKPAWCPGCGNFGILAALKKALIDLNLPPYQVLIVSGIGQAGKLPHYLKCNTFNSLHGRAVPAAIGAKIANHQLTVIAAVGDGDGYGEGGNHWLHAMRRNHNITYLVHDNRVYALTRGQVSPTSDAGMVSKTIPEGASQPLNPLLLAIASDASFVARGFSGEIEHLAGLIKQAILHDGFSFLDILQPCVSFNHVNTQEWYSKRIYKLEEDKGYDLFNKITAFERAQQWGDKIPIGIIYRNNRPAFEQGLSVIHTTPLAKQRFDSKKLEKLLTTFE